MYRAHMSSRRQLGGVRHSGNKHIKNAISAQSTRIEVHSVVISTSIEVHSVVILLVSRQKIEELFI